MYQLYSRNNRFDNTPYAYARMDYLRGRIDENFQKLVHARRLSTGRLDSSHILRTILISLAVSFNGDLQSYVRDVEVAARRLVQGLGITTPTSTGRLHLESHFYSDCPEILLSGFQGDWTLMDLWRSWRTMESVRVVNHPIADTEVIELGVMNNAIIQKPDLAVILIDIPLMAAQWQMWKSAYPDGTMEHFITEIPLVNAVKSHLNVAFFNNVQAEIGTRDRCHVRGNLPFAQTPTDEHAMALAGQVYSNCSSKEMTGNMILDSIPVPYGTSYLDSVDLPEFPPVSQMLWAIQASKMEAAAVALTFGSLAGFDKMLHDIIVLRRTLIQNQQNNTLRNGLTSAATVLLEERLQKDVIDRLPKVTA